MGNRLSPLMCVGLALATSAVVAVRAAAIEAPAAALKADEGIVNVPPGEMRGKVTDADGRTPHPGVLLVVLDAETGLEVAATTTDPNGEYALADLQEGEYLVLVGSPGYMAVIRVVAGAVAASVDIMIPKLVISDLVGGWFAERPVLAWSLTGLGAAALIATPVIVSSDDGDDDDDDHRLGMISSTTP